MGCAGDMLMAALYELLPDQKAFLEKMEVLKTLHIQIIPEKCVKCGVTGTHMRVLAHGDEESDISHPHTHPGTAHTHIKSPAYTLEHTQEHTHEHTHEHTREHAHEHAHEHANPLQRDGAADGAPHHGYLELLRLIETLEFPELVKVNAAAVYKLLGEAESAIHGQAIEHVHFHEIGSLDALADITGVCLALHMLEPDEITATAVHTGAGNVRCAHGILPVPAPATAMLLTGIPSYGGDIMGELTTPTGAALIKHFVNRFDKSEPGITRAIGYGMGTKDFPRLNAVRAFLIDSAGGSQGGPGYDEIVKLETNIDDMTGEDIGHAAAELMNRGALDVFQTPVFMKKFRPGTMLTVLCRASEEIRLTRSIFELTSTLGIRRENIRRAVLDRRIEVRDGVRVKVSEGWGVSREKIEYEDRII